MDTSRHPSTPSVTVNGRPRPITDVPAHTTVLDWLRGLGLTGSKEGCAEGECGACSVLVARPAPEDAARTEWTALNACLVPAAALDGQEVVTAEGLGTTDRPAPGAARDGDPRRLAVRLLHPGLRVQHGRGVLPRRPHHPAADGEAHHECGPNGFDLHALSGNLCRCTGYRPIRDAAYALGRAGARRRAGHPPHHPGARRRRDPLRHRRGPLRAPRRPRRGARAARRAPRCPGRRGLHRLGRRGQPARAPRRARRRRRPARRSCAGFEVADTTVTSAPRSPSPRSSGCWPAACRCWTRCSRSSPRG